MTALQLPISVRMDAFEHYLELVVLLRCLFRNAPQIKSESVSWNEVTESESRVQSGPYHTDFPVLNQTGSCPPSHG